jgi:hypothetical protein
LRKPEETTTRQVARFFGKASGQVSHGEQMKHRIDSDQGRHMITWRLVRVDNRRANKRAWTASRYAGRKKVDAQWKWYCP